MDKLCAGWREANNRPGVTPAGIYWHGGGLNHADGTTILNTAGSRSPMEPRRR